MPCPHKFENDLNPRALSFQPTTLIVGTFNPSWPEGNTATWFYGRARNNYFWDVLPRLYNPTINLRQASDDIKKNFCKENQILLTDLITSINDADPENEEHKDILGSYLDTSIADYFEDFTFTDVKGLLEKYSSIRNIYLTRQPGIDLFDEQWTLIEEYKKNVDSGLHIQTLLTPSASARFQIKPYKLSNPQDKTPLRNFIFQSWQNQWHNQPNS